MSDTVYQIVTEQIIAKLEAGVAPWRQPWTGGRGEAMLPCNLISKRRYTGINCLLLSLNPFSSPYYLTFKQCQGLKGRVKKGAKSSVVVFWKFFDRPDTEGDGEQDDSKASSYRPAMLRYYRVFNVDQCEGLEKHIPAAPEPTDGEEFNPIEAAAKVIADMPQRPEIVHREQRAYYSPRLDKINLPKPASFESPSHYYATAFHELTHSTGHETRLNRATVSGTDKLAAFGSPDYSKEELVAELGAAFLCATVGITDTIEPSAAYLQSWLKVLKADTRMIVMAASAAQKAADFILGINPKQN